MHKTWMFALVTAALAWAQTEDADTKAIRQVAEIYISADAARLPSAFTTTANLYTTGENGAQRIIPVAEYIERVKANAGRGMADRKSSIERIERDGNAANVTIRTLTPTSMVTDYLSMLRLEGGWKIVAKTFVVEPQVCAGANRHLFDFMIGNWNTADQSAIGTSIVEATLGGCVVHEHRQVSRDGKRLFDGDAYWSYDTTTKHWLLFYLDDQSHAQLYEGREDGGHLAFYRERPDPDGKMILIRIAYQPKDGGYTQVVERSADHGRTWESGGTTTYRSTPRAVLSR